MRSHTSQLARTDSQFTDLIELFRPLEILEIGSWYGASLLGFLETSKKLGIDTRAVAVDTWLGSHEHWLNLIPRDDWSRRSLGIKNGEPTFFSTFKKNIRKAGFSERVKVVRAPSEIALPYLRSQNYSPGLVYIDGDHSFRATHIDIRNSMRLGGDSSYPVCAGDDWTWVSVRRAVIVASWTHGLRVLVKGKMWLMLGRGHEAWGTLRERSWAPQGPVRLIINLLPYPKPSQVRKQVRRVQRRVLDPLLRLLFTR